MWINESTYGFVFIDVGGGGAETTVTFPAAMHRLRLHRDGAGVWCDFDGRRLEMVFPATESPIVPTITTEQLGIRSHYVRRDTPLTTSTRASQRHTQVGFQGRHADRPTFHLVFGRARSGNLVVEWTPLSASTPSSVGSD